MNVLVIGGTRFIGRATVMRLVREGHDVTLLNPGLKADPFGTRVRRVMGDRRDAATIKRAAEKRDYDVVLDITAHHESETAAMVEAFRGRITQFIHISTAAVYLIREGLLPPFREPQFSGRVVARSGRGESLWLHAYHKRRCEEVLLRAWEESSFPFTTLRLPMVVGHNDYTRRADTYLERLITGGPLLLPEGGLNSWGFLWVDDVAEVVAGNLANSGAIGRAYNVAQREAMTLRSFVELVAACLERRPQLLSLPASWLTAVGLGTGFSPYTYDHDILLDCHAAEEDLLFRPTPSERWVQLLADDFMKRWDGVPKTLATTRRFEISLAQEVAKIRLPSYVSGEHSGKT